MQTKRLFLAFFLIFSFLIIYSHVGSKYLPTSQPSPRPVDTPKPQISIPDFSQQAEVTDLQEATIGGFIITFSLTKGYVKEIRSVDFPQDNLLLTNIGANYPNYGEFTHQLETDRIIFTSADGYKKEIIFDQYLVTIKVSSSSSQAPIPQSIAVFSSVLSADNLQRNYQELFYLHNNLIERQPIRKAKEKFLEKVSFAGIRTQYFCAALLKNSYDIHWVKDEKSGVLLVLPALTEATFYVGAQNQKTLQQFDLKEVINYGFFHGIGVAIVKLLIFIHKITKSWGLGIICLAFIIYFLLFPFTMATTNAMKKMQMLQPRIEELKGKYKDNPQKLNQAILELYREYRINPLGGCLPVLLQFPVFITLYQVFLRLPELKGSQFLWINDLTLPDRLAKLPFSGPLAYVNLFPILIALVGLIQQRFTSATMNPDQKKMGLFFSLFLGAIFYNFPASINIYWFIQNTLTLGYQAFLYRKK